MPEASHAAGGGGVFCFSQVERGREEERMEVPVQGEVVSLSHPHWLLPQSTQVHPLPSAPHPFLSAEMNKRFLGKQTVNHDLGSATPETVPSKTPGRENPYRRQQGGHPEAAFLGKQPSPVPWGAWTTSQTLAAPPGRTYTRAWEV